MKSAEQRANELAELLGIGPGESTYGSILRALKEHARDQRHQCASEVLAVADRYAPGEVAFPRVMGSIAHYAVLNAPEPNSAA